MTAKTLKALFSVLMIAGVMYLMVPEDLMARAGGGGSYSGSSYHSSYSSSSYSSSGGGGDGAGGGILGAMGFIWAFGVSIVTGIISFIAGMKLKGAIVKKNERARSLLEKIDDNDPLWDRDAIHARIEEIYFAVQYAWTRRDQSRARAYMSSRIYKKHKAQTDAMKSDGLINKLKRVNLEDVKIIGVFDSPNDNKDRLKALIYGGMIDYMWNEKDETIVNGTTEYKHFMEIWNFVRKEDDWVLDEIEQSVDAQSVKNAKVYSHLLKKMAA